MINMKKYMRVFTKEKPIKISKGKIKIGRRYCYRRAVCFLEVIS